MKSDDTQLILEILDNVDQTRTYKKVLEHRRNCPKWGKELCRECWGGGLTEFSRNLSTEIELLILQKKIFKRNHPKTKLTDLEIMGITNWKGH